MLPLQNLDDKTFTQLIEDAKKIIPRYAPDWTDHNAHDPGITFMELFAWLTETQQYYLDRIRDENYRKFLKLLDIRLKCAVPARTDMVLSFSRESLTALEESIVIPAGTAFQAGGMVFETEEPAIVSSAKIDRIVTDLNRGFVDHTRANAHGGICFYPFGEEAEEGNALYMGFSEPLVKPDLSSSPQPAYMSIGLRVYDDYPVSIGRHGDETTVTTSPVSLQWEYSAKDSQGRDTWAALTVVKDETFNLSRSGRLTFLPPEGIFNTWPFDSSRCWVRCVIKKGAYELSPKLYDIIFNTVPVVQQQTCCDFAVFSGDGGKTRECPVLTYPALLSREKSLVQVREQNGGWKYWTRVQLFDSSGPEDLHFTINTKGVPTIAFGDGQRGKIPPQGKENIRVISPVVLDEMESTGLPGQTMSASRSPVTPGSLMLQVRENSGEDLLWFDWTQVDYFDASRPTDRHYTVDHATGEIRFGDGINGLIPPAPAQGGPNIRIIRYASGGGSRGNVDREAIKSIPQAALQYIKEEKLKGLKITVSNPLPASGGAEAETLAEAQARARQEIKSLSRAVTSQDYERLALSTPGLRVARAKAIPLYDPKAASGEEVPTSVTVVAVPYSSASKPAAFPQFLSDVKRHLCKHRLLTTEVHVVSPEYVEIFVEAEVTFKSGFTPDVKKVTDRLDSFLSPLANNSGYEGWAFGRTVYKSEIYRAIEEIEGVDYVGEVNLSASGADYIKDDKGNIRIQSNSLVYPGRHWIEVFGPARTAGR